MIYGYMRVSTSKKDKDTGEYVQSFDLQRDALIRAGVQPENIYEDRASGAKEDRPGLSELLDILQPGDTVVVWKIDRLGRNARHILQLHEQFKKQDINVRSLVDGFDSTSKMGIIVLSLMASFAELERENTRERVTAGIQASIARGGRIGRRKALSPDGRNDVAQSYEAGSTVSELARRYRVSRKTIQRTLKDSGYQFSG